MIRELQRLDEYSLTLTISPNESKYTQELSKYAIDNKLDITFRGSLPREKVFEFYTNSVLVFPSYLESFGLPLLEARLIGAPIIASDTSFSREILEGYDNAVFFSEMNSESMGQKIIEVGEKIR